MAFFAWMTDRWFAANIEFSGCLRVGKQFLVGEQISSVVSGEPSISSWLFHPLTLLLLVFVVILLLALKPQVKVESDQADPTAGMKAGDRVVTHAGIHGTVTGMDGGLVRLRVDDHTGTQITFNRDAIAQIVHTDNKE